MGIQIKLVSRIEFDLLKSGQIDFIDTFLKSEFEIGESIYLRCHYAQLYVDDFEQILKSVQRVSSISYNSNFQKYLYRVYFV
jgi:hypothetical protein